MSGQIKILLHPSGDGLNSDPPEARKRAHSWNHRMVFQPKKRGFTMAEYRDRDNENHNHNRSRSNSRSKAIDKNKIINRIVIVPRRSRRRSW
jgi:hypothetical protein